MQENAWLELTDYLVNLLTIKENETEVLFLCKMAALMKPLFEKANHPMNFFIFLYGHSGVGKTVLAKLFFVQDSGQDKNFKMDSQLDVEKRFNIIKVTQCLLMIIIQKLPITEKRNKIQ